MAEQEQNQEQEQPTTRYNTRTAPLERRQRTVENMTEAEHVDGWGRKFRVMVKGNQEPSKGMILGPVPLDGLGLRREVMVALHNGLYDRGIITPRDARQRPMEILAALNAAQAISVQRIQNLYAGVQEAEQAQAEATTPPSDMERPSTARLREGQMSPQTARSMTTEQEDTAKEDGSDAQARS